jgi:signal transduction histidine kinase
MTTIPSADARWFRTLVSSPFETASWRALGAVVLGFVIAALAMGTVSTLFSTGGSVLIWLVGIPVVGLGIEAARIAARVERWRMTLVDPRPLTPHAYREFDLPPRRPYGPWIRAAAETEFLDANRWRDVVYVLLAGPIATLELAVVVVLWASAVGLIGLGAVRLAYDVGPFASFGWWLAASAILVGLILVPLAAWSARGLLMLHRAVVEGLLCADSTEALRRDVERLRGSRAAAVDLEANELRRIERDLHDGAQQRLVALAIDLGRAEDRIDADPAGAKALVVKARDEARLALAELRDLVRGSAPAILLDRGLVAALGAVAGASPIPVSLGGTLANDARLPASVERAAYFVVAEALANVAKHAEAARCDIVVDRLSDRLAVEIRDDGHGGATVAPGGGLAGLRDRVEALDGTLALTSPTGGPTVLRVEIPLGTPA